MQVSISEASRRFAVSRNTIYEHAKDGMITIHTDEQGKKRVDVADLHRLYAARHQETSAVVNGEQLRTLEHDSQHAVLQAKIELLELRIQDKDDQIRELREDRTWLRGQVERQTDQIKLLTDQTTQSHRSWWRFWEATTSTQPTEAVS